MTDAQRTEYNDYLQARIAGDLGDYIDLIIRKANSKGRECEPNKPLPTIK
jgi:hypothetical protein